MTISEDFAICPWCGEEDNTWPTYHRKNVRRSYNKTCKNCGKQYQVIETVKIMKIPVHESAQERFGEYMEHPINRFETRKMVGTNCCKHHPRKHKISL